MYFISSCNIAGGRETRTYGVMVRTGELVYECSMEGCSNATENLASDDMLVIQRHTQTVRAVEGRSGTERLVFLLFVYDSKCEALLCKELVEEHY
jgi:hypothetical protein